MMNLLSIGMVQIPLGKTRTLTCTCPWDGTSTGPEYQATTETYVIEQITVDEAALLLSPIGPGLTYERALRDYQVKQVDAESHARVELENQRIKRMLAYIATGDQSHLTEPEDQDWIRRRARELAGEPPRATLIRLHAGSTVSIIVRNAGEKPMLFQAILPITIVEKTVGDA